MNKDDKIYVAGHRGMVGSAIKRRLEKEGYTNIIVKTSKEGGHPKQIIPSFFDGFVRFVGTVYGLFNNIGVYSDLKEDGYDVDFFDIV